MNALAARVDDDVRSLAMTLASSNEVATPLSASTRLAVISDRAAALARLYGRGAAYRTIGKCRWRLHWRYFTGALTGVEILLRIGDARALLCVESLGAFGCATEAMRPEMPQALRAAYLSGIGAPVWQELEAITRRAVEVLGVEPRSGIEITADCLCFEVGQADPRGPATRGFLRLVDTVPERNAQLQRLLVETSEREMAEALLPTHLPLQWAAVAGSTRLTATEVRGLEEHDVVLIDDTKPATNGLGCWLGVGPTRRFAGRAMLRNGGQLQIVHVATGGDIDMSANTQSVLSEKTGFGEIPVTVRFELAHWNASLAEVGKLVGGSVVDLGQRIDDQSVSVWVEERCIGKGQLVAVGERLGVRLLSVFGEPASQESV